MRIRQRNRLWVWIKKRRQRGGSAPEVDTVRIGDVDTVTLVVVFNETVQSADFADGVTIEVNGAPVVIGSATLQGDGVTVYYVIPAADNNDTVTWEYSGGSIEDAAGTDLADVSAQTASNYIGTQWWFHDLNASGHLVSIGL